MLGYKCICGGNLFSIGDGGYICDSCELDWYRCSLCNGTLHTQNKGELILEVICIDKRKNRKET